MDSFTQADRSRGETYSDAGGGRCEQGSRRGEKARADAGELVHRRMTGVSRAARPCRAHFHRQPLLPMVGFARAAGPDHWPKERSTVQPERKRRKCRQNTAQHGARKSIFTVGRRRRFGKSPLPGTRRWLRGRRCAVRPAGFSCPWRSLSAAVSSRRAIRA